jgi:hypothetical protein
MSMRPTLVLCLAAWAAAPLDAQQRDSGTVHVIVRESMGMVEGFLIRSEGRSAHTSSSGRAWLVLPTGSRTIDVTRLGFVP